MYKNYLFLGVLSIMFIFLNKKNKQSGGSKIKTKQKSIEGYDMLNIYDEPLQKCGDSKMYDGSWDNDKKCSELGGGVHQICIKNIAKNTNKFSKTTGQTDWSSDRLNNNHCVCLGAWSLYVAKKTRQNKAIKKNILKCDAIPKVSLSESYVSKFSEGWNKWNGIEINNQIKEGVEELVNNCYHGPKRNVLKKNYCNFASKVGSLSNTDMYNKLCK